MSLARIFRALRLKRELDRKLRARRIIRMARAEAARRGVSAYWRRVGEQTRALFGGMG